MSEEVDGVALEAEPDVGVDGDADVGVPQQPRRTLAATGPADPPTAARFAWWEAAAQFPPRPGEPCFWLPTRRTPSRADLQAASLRLEAAVLPLPAAGRFSPEPDERTLLLAHRLHARIAHPVHAAALALRILTGRPQAQLPGPTTRGTNTPTDPGRQAGTPPWANRPGPQVSSRQDSASGIWTARPAARGHCDSAPGSRLP